MSNDFLHGFATLEECEEIVSFRLFAESELENVSDDRIEPNAITDRRQHMLKANEFDYKLLGKQNSLLMKRKLDSQPPWFALNDYMDSLRGDYKTKFIFKRIPNS